MSNVFFLIIINDLLDTAATLLMKKGDGHFDTYYVYIGFVFYVINFLVWMKILAKVELSVALPLASASYILVPLTSIFFLREDVGFWRWIAIFLIILGVYFVSLSSPKKMINEDQHV